MLKSNQKGRTWICFVFSRLQIVVLKDFVLFLKQESGLRAQGSRNKKGIQQIVAREVEGKGIFKPFSNSGNLVNLAKSVLNSIYTTLQAETLILTCPPSFPLFCCQSFRRRGSPIKANSHESSTCARLPIRIQNNVPQIFATINFSSREIDGEFLSVWKNFMGDKFRSNKSFKLGQIWHRQRHS